MGLGIYKATGRFMTAVLRCGGIKVRVSDADALPDRPILFMANHFTRFETFLLPYVIFHRYRLPVRSLAAHMFFSGRFGQYMRAMGVISVRDPHRNRTIVGGLMTGRSDWVIYPEGAMIKNKKTVKDGRLHLQRPDRTGPPHTGAALLALKSEDQKRRYLHACATGDRVLRSRYEVRYEIRSPEDLHPESTVIIPVTMTYPRLRAGRNILHRLGTMLSKRLHPNFDEELQVEGSILFRESDISVHFGEPIDVVDYVGVQSELTDRLTGIFRKQERREELGLRRNARRLTGDSMRRVYESAEVNFDHLFCYGLRASRTDTIDVGSFRRALYLAAMELRHHGDVRLHPLLRNGIVALTTDAPLPALTCIESLAGRQGIIRLEHGTYHLDRDALESHHDIHSIRLDNTVQVIANELEPVDQATSIIRHIMSLTPAELSARLVEQLPSRAADRFRREYERWHDPEHSKPPVVGEPFVLHPSGATTGVVLVHGYLAVPAQMRPLAEYLEAEGYAVHAVRLPGHGTVPEHLNDVCWTEWMEPVLEALAVMRHRTDRTVVAGFSLGGVLAAIAASQHPEHVDGLITINAPMRLANRWAPLVPAATALRRFTGRFSRDDCGTELSNLASEDPELNYRAHGLRAVRELRRAVAAAQRSLSTIVAPTLVVQSESDPVVVPRSAERIHEGVAADMKRLHWLESERHVVMRNEDHEHVARAIVEFLQELDRTDDQLIN